jgi:hypothetical protein
MFSIRAAASNLRQLDLGESELIPVVAVSPFAKSLEKRRVCAKPFQETRHPLNGYVGPMECSVGLGWRKAYGAGRKEKNI